jgi:ABC-type bacteriocin/lantibiotic exporter with double-glycine peptidase domain
MAPAAGHGRKFFVPEIVQTSATDCGPAALAAVLVGHGISADYARLREACQTSVDGTSIDTLEEIAVRLGLNAAQYIQRPEDILLPEAGNFPALLVTRLPEGGLHFIVAWRRIADFVQIMDPGSGRSWMHIDGLKRILHIHEQRVEGDAFCDFAAHGPFSAVLRHRLRKIHGQGSDAFLDTALERGSWADLAGLDATARLVTQLLESGALRSGAQARAAFLRLYERARAEAVSDCDAIPKSSWTVRPPKNDSSELLWSGAVALRLLGRQEAAARDSLPPALRLGDQSKPRSPLLSVLALVPRERPGAAILFSLGTLLSVFGVVVQALAVRSLLGVDQVLLLPRQRLAGLALYALVLLLLVAADAAMESFLVRVGRHLEVRLWAAILEKVPKLAERYFQSRLVTDMADRAQSVHHLRRLPGFAFQTLRAALDLSVSVVAVGLADPRSLPVAAFAFAMCFALPLLFRAMLAERDLRLHMHLVALSRLLLDALLGAMPLRSHGAQRPLKREQEAVLAEWAHASRSAVRASVMLSGVQALSSTVFLVVLLYGYLTRHPGVNAGILVLLYWGGRLPALAQLLVDLWREYPVLHNVAARLVEPLQAPEETANAPAPPQPSRAREPGPRVEFRNATVKVAGKRIVEDVSLQLAPGAHVAIVGRSGAGKSTLLGLLMGWYLPDSGEVQLDGRKLDGGELERLRAQIAWVDPAIHLWNRALLDNVRYGGPQDPSASLLGRVMADAELIDVIERLPEGMQTALGEGGRLLSGGEGQRVRYARALLRSRARLVLFDEPFRGLERQVRARLLRQARAIWSHATLLCVTHDISETEGFDRVIVMEGGRVAEDGPPLQLQEQPGSLYSRLLEAERRTQSALIEARRWRRFTVEDGRLVAVDGEP